MNKQKFQDLLNQTRKSKDKISQGVYEDLLSRIGNKEIALKVNELSSSEIISILKKMSDERHESFTIFIANNKNELAWKEYNENEIIKTHLPQTFSKEETEKLVDDYLELSSAVPSKKMMGSIIKYFKENYEGKIDMKVLSTVLNSKLT